MKRKYSLALVFLKILIFVNASGFYSIVAPGTLQSHHRYSVSVTVHENSGPATIKVGIIGPLYNETKTLDVAASQTEVVDFDVPQLKSGNYKLETEGIKGLVFKNSTDLIFKNKEPKVYIQTDKATYKPSDLVQYRIIALDDETRPAKPETPLRLGFKDGAGNFVKQINDIKLTKGVYSGDFQLSEQPVLGNWIMEVTLGPHEDDTKTEKKFEVAKYVLPKFSVDIESAKDIAYGDPLKITVRSKYTYGKPVKGQATVTIDAKNGETKSEKVIEVDGKGYVEFDMAKDLDLDVPTADRRFGYYSYIYTPPIHVLVVMTEEYTGNKQNKTATVNLHRSRYNIEVPNTIYDYYANQPFDYKVFIKNLDGSPVQNSKHVAKLSIDKQYTYYHDLEGKTPDAAEFMFTSELDQNGMAVFKVTLPSAEYYYNIRVTYADQIRNLPSLRGRAQNSASKDDKPKEEEDVGPLKLIKKTEKPQLHEDVIVEVKSNQNIPYYVYSIVGRGNIIKQEHVKLPENTKSHEIKFKPSFKMIPEAHLFVYFVRDGDLKFQEMSLSFPKEFLNKIEITAPKQAKPGEEVALNIKTDPGSFVGLLGVDQSVLLLQSGNDLDTAKILNDLSSYDTSTPYIRGYGEYPGGSSGLVTLTNAHYPYSTARDFSDEFFDISDRSLFSNGLRFQFRTDILRSGPRDRYNGNSFRSFRPSQDVASNRNTVPKIRKMFVENWIFNYLNKYDNQNSHLHFISVIKLCFVVAASCRFASLF